MNDPILILKIAGAVLALALGIWIGLGMPGARRTPPKREWRSTDRLKATWINRMFFRMDRPARRFDVGRLIVPGEAEGKGGPGSDEAKGEDEELVRLRKPRAR
ncbi:MAG: hypothetical protein JSU87_07260 [Gemmatimonadota bacterium]|nr:MAG: hypothetical protein JSU87_07260 [Gemmatimonadota bacterium]